MSVENRLGRPQEVESVLEEKATPEGVSGISGGWVKTEEPGVYTTAKPYRDFTTPEYAAFAERSRARWDLVTYLGVCLKQRIRRLQGR